MIITDPYCYIFSSAPNIESSIIYCRVNTTLIKRLRRIKNFGVFDDFVWPPKVPEFKRFNLIYGWNYSGKTTLSRALGCFETKNRHDDFPAAEVELEIEDGKTLSFGDGNSTLRLRVFNTNFVRQNLSFDTGGMEPLIILGEENIEKQEDLKKKRAERDAISGKIASDKEQIDSTSNAIETALTAYARDHIKNGLSVPMYDKTRFQRAVDACCSSPETYILSDTEYSEQKSIFEAKSKKQVLPRRQFALTSVTVLNSDLAPLLENIVSGNKPIMRLKENPKIQAWVRDGRPLHDGKTTCQFCDQPLPRNLLREIADHFSAEYEGLMSALDDLEERIQIAINEPFDIGTRSDFYEDLAPAFDAASVRIRQLLQVRIHSLSQLHKLLGEKRSKAFASMASPSVKDPASEFLKPLEDMNEIVEKHNQRTREFEDARNKALASLQKHWAATFVRDQDYPNKLQTIETLQALVRDQSKQLAKFENEISKLESEVSELQRGADFVNELLTACFGNSRLRIQVLSGGKFQIMRGKASAKSLSEGEKTAIAFAYFATSVRDGRTPIEDITVVIDDPVSSLDASHIFNTYSLIRNSFCPCCQLFILTHNFEFYNLIRDWIEDTEKKSEKPMHEWNNWGAFLITRHVPDRATIEQMPGELLKFKSEYHYLFSILYRFEHGNNTNIEQFHHLPNIARRFLETFGGIMIPLRKTLKSKMERIFPDRMKRERVWKFINQHSHAAGVTHAVHVPDTSECQTVITLCIKAVEEWDSEYYTDLVSSIA